jgi:hypothetical protein
MRRLLVALAAALVVLAGPSGHTAAQENAAFEKKKRTVLVEGGHRHLELGVWARKGLVPQATTEFIRAVEVSEGRHPGANKVLGIMRSLDEAFWTKRRRKVHTGLLDQYEKRAKKAQLAFEKDRAALAAWAAKKGFEQLADDEYRGLLRSRDKPLEFDAKGRIKLEKATIPAEPSARIKAAAVAINDKLYVRDEFLELLPDVTEIYEAEGERVRVRCQTSNEQAADVLAIAEALLPQLAEDTGGRPTSLMKLFVFKEKETYDQYLDAADLSQHKVASGLAVGGAFIALVNGGGRDDEAIRGIALHELSHLFMFGVTRVVMPSWYSEGFAETYGGTGTFTWKDGKLTLGGKMSAYRVDPLRGEGYIPLRELVGGVAHDLLRKDKGRAHRFYAESWAFVRFMCSDEAGKDVAERFAVWEDTCRGKALGAEIGKPESRNSRPAQDLFLRTFRDDLDDLDARFREWLKTL